MWDELFKHLPTLMLIGIAVIICGADLLKAIRVWKDERTKRRKVITDAYQEELNLLSEFKKIHERFDKLDERLSNLETRMDSAETKLIDLTISDMHDIKAWIVEQYHKFYVQQGWIDAFSAETIDRRYTDYINEGGNSYVENLINQLHTLPMDPQERR